MRGSFSILVLWCVILVSGFDTVVSVTEALPVALIPEQHAVSSVRLDVIDIGCLDIMSLLHALHTKRICRKSAGSTSGLCCTEQRKVVIFPLS